MGRKKIALLLVLAIALVGCQSKEVEVTPIETEVEVEAQVPEEQIAPQEGGTLHLSMRMASTLNPLLNEEKTVDNALKLLFTPLVAIDESQKPVPSIAKSWSFSEDGRTIFIELREDAVFHDGSGITAEDVMYSLRTLEVAPENAVYKNALGYIETYKKTGQKSLSITFRQAFSGNLYVLGFPVISASYYGGKNALNSKNNLIPMGTGYYSFVNFEPVKELRLKKATTVFGKTPYIDEIVVSVSQDKDTEFFAFDQGVIDALAVDALDIGKIGSQGKSKIYSYPSNYYDFLGFNFNREFCNNVYFRKAIAHVLPKEEILQGIYLSQAVLTDTPVNPKSWLYEENVEKYNYDLQKAKEYLQQAGYQDVDNDGLLEKTADGSNGKLSVSILVNQENTARKQIATRLAEEIGAIGGQATVVSVPFDQYQEKLEAKDYDIFVGGYRLSIVPDFTFLLHSSRVNTTNYTGYANEGMDRILGEVYTAFDERKMQAAYSNLQQHISTELPYISIAYRSAAVFTREGVYGDIVPVEENVFYTVNQWFLYQK